MADVQSDIQIRLEFTPNPMTLKFVVDRSLLERGALNFTDVPSTEKAPLARSLFGVTGVCGVLIGTNFVTITKSTEGSWDVVAEEIPKVIETFLKTGQPIVDASLLAAKSQSAEPGSSEAERRIREVLDNEIRPAVAMDGGDITFAKFEDGIVYLHLQGACSSCPSSVATLKMGVETRLKEAVPEVREVVQM